MNEKQFVSNVRLSAQLFQKMDLLASVSSYGSIIPPEEFRDISLRRNSHYGEIYLKALELSVYNFILKDFSYFQFNRTSDDELRYAYYPNPYSASDNEGEDIIKLASEEGIDYEDLSQILCEANYTAHKPMIRCEFSAKQYKEFTHPASHFHFGTDGTSRWPSKIVLTPLVFSMNIARLYYHEAWAGAEPEGDVRAPYLNALDTQFAAKRGECRIVSNTLLSEAERCFVVFT